MLSSFHLFTQYSNILITTWILGAWHIASNLSWMKSELYFHIYLFVVLSIRFHGNGCSKRSGNAPKINATHVRSELTVYMVQPLKQFVEFTHNWNYFCMVFKFIYILLKFYNDCLQAEFSRKKYIIVTRSVNILATKTRCVSTLAASFVEKISWYER